MDIMNEKIIILIQTDKKPAIVAANNLLMAYFLGPVRIIQNGGTFSSRSEAKDIPYGNIGAIHRINKVDPLPLRACPSIYITSAVSDMNPELLIIITNKINTMDIRNASDNKALYKSAISREMNTFISSTYPHTALQLLHERHHIYIG